MIECPKCKEKHISVVSVTKNEQADKSILKQIQLICALFLIVSVVSFINTATARPNKFEDFLESITNISSNNNTENSNNNIQSLESINGGGTAPVNNQSINTLFVCAWFIKWLTITIITVGIIRVVLPKQIYSYEKCICHECEFQWKYTIEKSEPQEQENQDKKIYFH